MSSNNNGGESKGEHRRQEALEQQQSDRELALSLQEEERRKRTQEGFRNFRTEAAAARGRRRNGTSKSWKERIKDAILAIDSATGASLPAIKKELGADKSQWRYVNAALRSGRADGTFVLDGGKWKVKNTQGPPTGMFGFPFGGVTNKETPIHNPTAARNARAHAAEVRSQNWRQNPSARRNNRLEPSPRRAAALSAELTNYEKQVLIRLDMMLKCCEQLKPALPPLPLENSGVSAQREDSSSLEGELPTGYIRTDALMGGKKKYRKKKSKKKSRKKKRTRKKRTRKK